MNPQLHNALPPAPPTKQPSGSFSPKLLFIGIGVVVALIIAVTLLFLSNSNSPTTQMQRLSLRLDGLQTIIGEGSKNVRGGDLKKIHSDAMILVSSNSVRLKDDLAAAGLGKIPNEVTALESDETTMATLEDARLNGSFDTAYKKALSQKLESTMALMREIHDKTNSKTLKASLSTAYDHFDGLLEQLATLQ